MSEICRISRQNKFVKLVHLVGFIIKKYGYCYTGSNLVSYIQAAVCRYIALGIETN